MSTRDQKCQLDRQNWHTCSNLFPMHGDIASEMVDSGMSEILDEPDHMDSHGNCVYSKDNDFGFPATHYIIHSSCAIVADELGRNMSQKGDGNVSGAKFLCEKCLVPRKVTSNQDNNF